MLGFLFFSIVATVSSDLAIVSSDLVAVEKTSFAMLGFLSSSVFANLIALLALSLAILGLYKQRKDVVVDFLPILDILNAKDLYINGIEHAANAPMFFCSQISILNASPHDLSFFDLRAFNPRTNANYAFISQSRLPPQFPSLYIQVKDGGTFINKNIPVTRHGTIKAHSFTNLDILIYKDCFSDNFEDSIILSFKVPIRTWIKKDPFSDTNRKRFKRYSKEYTVTGWQSKYEEMQEAEKQEAASERTCK